MKTSRSFLLLPFVLGFASAQTTPLLRVPTATSHELLDLEAIVVTAGTDPKSAFDLAQGASILSGDSLHRNLAATLGETLSATPGVNSTYYGPGASRPIIRGLGGDRVRMLDNGVGSLDASNVSPDHNVSIEPLLVDRIEVLRGPATLLYGSAAVGGVVNVIDNRIPASAPVDPLSGRAEIRYDSGASEHTGIFALTSGNENFALQINGLRTSTDDIAIPGYADAANPINQGTLTNSAISTKSGSIGGTTFWSGGNAGAAISEYATVYGVPVGEPIAIDLKQRRADFRTETNRLGGIFKTAKIRFCLADYTHSEINPSTATTNTTFKNKAYEGRIELVQTGTDALSGTIGLQISRSNFSAVGEEVVTPATLTSNQAVFAVESFKLDPTLTAQFGVRVELQRIKLGEVDPLLPRYPGYSATTGEIRRDHSVSLSTGLVYYPAKDYSVGFSLAYSQRLPVAQEVFSNGPHGGTNAYEIGTADLSKENSLGLDLTVRKRSGFITGSAGVFVNQFQNYIFEQRDPIRYRDENSGDFRPYPVPADDAYLPIYQFIARDALFYGGEIETSLHLIESETDRLHLQLTSDYVHAQQTTDDQPLPRIPPLRMGAALRYEHNRWAAGISARHAFAQNRITEEETATRGYTLIQADLSYHLPLEKMAWELFARGNNLTNTDARVSTSFLKDFAPLPGRSVTVGIRVTF